MIEQFHKLVLQICQVSLFLRLYLKKP